MTPEEAVKKYRSEHKGDQVTDLKKAVWYLQRKIELLEKKDGV